MPVTVNVFNVNKTVALPVLNLLMTVALFVVRTGALSVSIIFRTVWHYSSFFFGWDSGIVRLYFD